MTLSGRRTGRPAWEPRPSPHRRPPLSAGTALPVSRGCRGKRRWRGKSSARHRAKGSPGYEAQLGSVPRHQWQKTSSPAETQQPGGRSPGHTILKPSYNSRESKKKEESLRGQVTLQAFPHEGRQDQLPLTRVAPQTGHTSPWLLLQWCAQVVSRVRLRVTPQTVVHQAPLFRGFSRQEYWSGSPFPSFSKDLPDLGIKLGSPPHRSILHPLSHRVTPSCSGVAST